MTNYTSAQRYFFVSRRFHRFTDAAHLFGPTLFFWTYVRTSGFSLAWPLVRHINPSQMASGLFKAWTAGVIRVLSTQWLIFIVTSTHLSLHPMKRRCSFCISWPFFPDNLQTLWSLCGLWGGAESTPPAPTVAAACMFVQGCGSFQLLDGGGGSVQLCCSSSFSLSLANIFVVADHCSLVLPSGGVGLSLCLHPVQCEQWRHNSPQIYILGV